MGREGRQGQDMIPDIDTPEAPSGCSWGNLLELLCAAHGGWVGVVDLLMFRARGVVSLPDDPQTVERGLRRLAKRGHAEGGKYGRYLLRFFGVPDSLRRTARWMGQYHSRFADLPTSLRRSQLLLWDRPPICESSTAAWIHLGSASVAMRCLQFSGASERLERADKLAQASKDAEMQMETVLLRARLEADEDDKARALSRAEKIITRVAEPGQRTCYAARLADQRAYLLLHPSSGAPQLEAARDVYANIDAGVPFAAFRRHHGLAYCAYKQGDMPTASRLARQAADDAADAGLLRFRVMALKLHARILGQEDGESLLERAKRMARALEQEDLLS